MFDNIVSSIACLIGIASECNLQGAGAALSPLQNVIFTVAAGGVVLIVALWNDEIKRILKGSISDLLAFTALVFAAMAVPSVILAALAGLALLTALWVALRNSGGRLNLMNRAAVPLRRLVLPAASAVYVAGAAGIAVHGHLRPPQPEPDRTVAFFSPSQLIGTTMADLGPEDRISLLSNIDMGPKTLMTGNFDGTDFEFHPNFTPAQQLELRESFDLKSPTKLDLWLREHPDLKHLSQKVDIALEATVKVENSTSRQRAIVVRAYLNTRDADGTRFHRVISGDSIVATGTLATPNEALLVLTVRLTAKLLSDLGLPPLSPDVQTAVWHDFSDELQRRISNLVDANGADLPARLLDDAKGAMDLATECQTAECALQIAGILEAMILPRDREDGSAAPEAVASIKSAFGQ
ncbi:hypothetical protein [Sedimentitalea todarodis]|uniref:Uncharacterized protein n=1 Tax=Sedimentitalea todarodis TaxID=1631240 RepID=A0ABU3VDW8_9RHOB|nr:hypothetical protein [Sedimentitalea todarodis]MDU9004359.1 hypothetical protein [Sedimentitalea todarodis]